MSNMSSFYGGRPGAPFVIVKTFDTIELPSVEENKIIYTKSYYALDNEGNYLITTDKSVGNVQLNENNFLVKKTAENYYKYNWKLTINNGGVINQTEFKFPIEKAEGMVDCFKKGILTLDEVNYQEYVLIDTVTNLNEYLNPDNGKLFRRGLDINNGLYGAEYVGRIVGAQGYNTGIQLDTFDNIDKLNNSAKDKIVYADLIPGGYKEDEIIKENKDIQCIYANILDEGGNILETKIGFKFPYLVNTFLARPVVPYNLPDNLISEIDAAENDNPFYRHWEIKVPNGVKGDSIEIIRTQPTIIPANTPYYNSLDDLKADREAAGVIAKITEIPNNAYYADGDYILLADNAEQELNNKFINAKLCTNKKVFYIIRNYDTIEAGSVSEPILIGDIDSVVKTNLANDGTLTFHYDNGKIETVVPKLKWITSTKLNNDTSKLEISYNEDSKDIISPAINYIKEIYISTAEDSTNSNGDIPSKNLYIKFSDPDIQKLGVTIPNKGSGWTDFGSVQPPAEGLKIATNFDSVSELTGPPEQLLGSDIYKGYAVTVGENILYYYDYRENKWINAGTLTQENITTKIVTISNTDPGFSNMSAKGIWMVTSSINAR